jgi:hypothetical protein
MKRYEPIWNVMNLYEFIRDSGLCMQTNCESKTPTQAFPNPVTSARGSNLPLKLELTLLRCEFTLYPAAWQAPRIAHKATPPLLHRTEPRQTENGQKWPKLQAVSYLVRVWLLHIPPARRASLGAPRGGNLQNSLKLWCYSQIFLVIFYHAHISMGCLRCRTILRLC